MPAHTLRAAPPPVPPCLRAAVEVRRVNGHASFTGPLTDCEGRPTLHALAAISVLASPMHLDALPDLEPVVRELRRVAPAVGWVLVDEHPRRRARTPCPPGQESIVVAAVGDDASEHTETTRTAREGERTAHARDHRREARAACRVIDVPRDAHTHDPQVILDGRVRIVNPRLIAMLDEVTRHFGGRRVEMISGYRPSNNPQAGSRHAHARAMDYRIAGVTREALRDFAQTLPLAGVGYYPNSVFVHMDVRDRDEGSARWTDYSSHGETPRYGHWPPRDEDVSRESEFLVDQASRALDAARAVEEPDDEPASPATPATNEREPEHASPNARTADPAPSTEHSPEDSSTAP